MCDDANGMCVCVCALTHMWLGWGYMLAGICLHVVFRYIYVYLNFNIPRYVVEWELQVRQ